MKTTEKIIGYISYPRHEIGITLDASQQTKQAKISTTGNAVAIISTQNKREREREKK